jgi:hypothetical protein
MKLLLGLLFVLMVTFVPFVLIWAVNILFPIAAIPFTLETWLAAFVIGSLFTKTTYTK